MVEQKASVLVVDDEKDMRIRLRKDLEHFQLNIFEAENGIEALDYLSRVELIVSDICMPNGNGIDLLEETRKICPNKPAFFFVSGFPDISLSDAYEMGADGLFAKPYSKTEFLNAIAKSLKPESRRWNRFEVLQETSSQVFLECPSFGGALKGRLINIGRGGMFVHINNSFPKIDEIVSFKVVFKDGLYKPFEGAGIVRWTRTNLVKGYKLGFGLEFEYLSGESIDTVIQHIRKSNKKAYIPKG